MSQVNELLSQRTKLNKSSTKMAEMGRQSASGHLTSFSGIFSVSELSPNEKKGLEELLKTYSTENGDLRADLKALISLTSEVKAINNQATLLHGERIKKAHQILTRYRDGAFTTWLNATYGNRQTPYNFLQYYEFYQELSEPLRLRLEQMPRQAIYTLASRAGPLEKKQQLIEAYSGETKTALLETIRLHFPLETTDNRQENIGDKAINGMERVVKYLESMKKPFTRQQQEIFQGLLEYAQKLLETR